MFDITQGRSTGMQVQAISRSGTNDLRAVTYGFFRSDRFNAADPVANKVLPFQNQQVGGTLSGPIMRDRAHFFGSYEYERQPGTAFLAPMRLPSQTFEFETKDVNKNYLARVDYQYLQRQHLHRPRPALGVREPVPDLERHGASVHGRAAASVHDQHLRHLDAHRQQQPDDAAARRLQRLLLVQRRHSVERRAVLQHAVHGAADRSSRA